MRLSSNKHIFLLLLLCVLQLIASHQKVVNAVEVAVVGVGVFVRNIGEADMQLGLWYGDVNLYYRKANTTFESVEEAKRRAFRMETQSDGTTVLTNECNTDTMDFIPYLPVDDPNTFFGLDIMNLGAGPRIKIQRMLDENRIFSYFRIRGQFMFKTNLQDWPLDTQFFDIMIEETLAADDELTQLYCHLPKFSGLSTEIRMPGFLSSPPVDYDYAIYHNCMPPMIAPMCGVSCPLNEDCTNKATIEDCGCSKDSTLLELECNKTTCSQLQLKFPHINEKSPTCMCKGGTSINPRYHFSIEWSRPIRNALIRVYVPPSFITALVLTTYFLPVDAAATRIAVCASAIVATVMFHSSIEASAPPHSGALLSDNFILVVYVIEVAAVVSSIFMLALKESKRPVAAKELFKWSRTYGVVCSPALFSTAIHSVETRLFVPFIIIPLAVFVASVIRCYEIYRQINKVRRLRLEQTTKNANTAASDYTGAFVATKTMLVQTDTQQQVHGDDSSHHHPH